MANKNWLSYKTVNMDRLVFLNLNFIDALTVKVNIDNTDNIVRGSHKAQ